MEDSGFSNSSTSNFTNPSPLWKETATDVIHHTRPVVSDADRSKRKLFLPRINAAINDIQNRLQHELFTVHDILDQIETTLESETVMTIKYKKPRTRFFWKLLEENGFKVTGPELCSPTSLEYSNNNTYTITCPEHTDGFSCIDLIRELVKQNDERISLDMVSLEEMHTRMEVSQLHDVQPYVNFDEKWTTMITSFGKNCLWYHGFDTRKDRDWVVWDPEFNKPFVKDKPIYFPLERLFKREDYHRKSITAQEARDETILDDKIVAVSEEEELRF